LAVYEWAVSFGTASRGLGGAFLNTALVLWSHMQRHYVLRNNPKFPPRPLLAVPNVTGHPSTASVPITALLYNGSLLCGFNVPIKGLNGVSDSKFLTLDCCLAVTRVSCVQTPNFSGIHLYQLASQEPGSAGKEIR